MFVHGKPLLPRVTFAGKAGAYPNETPFRCSTLGLTRKHWTWLERLVREKHSNLLPKSVNFDHKKFYRIGPRVEVTHSVKHLTIRNLHDKIFILLNYKMFVKNTLAY